ncbi:MAG: hypothetical protein ACYCRF_01870 [Acidithiobacillus sp.]
MNNINQFDLIYDRLLSQFCGQHLITPVEAGVILGFRPNTTYSLVARQLFPIPFVIVGKKKMVRIIDLARFIAKIGGDDENGPLPALIQKRGRGRPPKGTGPKERDHAPHAPASI